MASVMAKGTDTHGQVEKAAFAQAMYSSLLASGIDSVWSNLLCGVLLVYIDYLLYLIVTAHEDAGPIVDMFGYDGQHTLHATVDCLSAR